LQDFLLNPGGYKWLSIRKYKLLHLFNAQRQADEIQVKPWIRLYQRLSSGLRINSAADDAAGCRFSNRLDISDNGLKSGCS